ncbi:MAG: C13 family peptidase [Erythrobacter sp.]|jgi:hypothetical protein|nr:C13 family peptidase [Erythrobacter sp.]
MGAALATFGTLAHAAQDDAAAHRPPEHTEPFPSLSIGETHAEARRSIELAPQLRRAVPARELLEQRRRLASALGALGPQRPGIVDAYVVSVALDSDAVFAREARETAEVLTRRYDADGRTLVLAGPDGRRDDRPTGSIEALLVALAHVAEVMDRSEDVLVLFTTSHGFRHGLAYHYGDTGYGILSPERLGEAFDTLGLTRRIVIINACHSGVFVPALEGPDSAVLTAAAAARSSFGCEAENDWTFFGDALINQALRKPQPLKSAIKEAARTVADWEIERGLLASLPQNSIGTRVPDWLEPLEARMSQTLAEPAGRRAIAKD